MEISISQTGIIVVMLLLAINGLSVLLREIRNNRRQPTQPKTNNRKVNRHVD